MTNKELVEKLRWYGNLAAMGPVDCELPEEACDDLFEAAEALEARQWVPVMERLPEVGVRVLVLDKWGHVRDRVLRELGNGGVYFTPDGMVPGADIKCWMCWMPLPRGPEEVE